MAYTKIDHYDAYGYINTFRASSFENRLMDLLAVADARNAKIIDDNWGHVIKRMADDYRIFKSKERGNV